MTRKLDFLTVCKKLVNEFKTGIEPIHDVKIMVFLEFSPTSWKVWKPKLIEYYLDEEYNFDNSEERFQISYDKKTKIWSSKKLLS